MKPHESINFAVRTFLSYAPEAKVHVVVNPVTYEKISHCGLDDGIMVEKSLLIEDDDFIIIDFNQPIIWREIPLPWYKKIWYWIKIKFTL